MTDAQRKILAAFACVIVAMTLFPPFEYRGMSGAVVTAGYGFLFTPPPHAVVDVSTLLLQWIAAVIASGIAFLLAKRR